MIRSPSPPHYGIKDRRTFCISLLYLVKQIHLVVSLPEVILYVIILRRYTQLDKFVLECPGLLEEAVYFAYFHNIGVISFASISPTAICRALAIFRDPLSKTIVTVSRFSFAS